MSSWKSGACSSATPMEHRQPRRQATGVRRSCAPVGSVKPLLPFSTDAVLVPGAGSHYHGICVWFHWRNLISYCLTENHKNANTLRSTSGGKLTQRISYLGSLPTSPLMTLRCSLHRLEPCSQGFGCTFLRRSVYFIPISLMAIAALQS